MPKTYIETQSILNEMQIDVNKEVKFRRALSYILEFKKSENSGYIEKINFKSNKIKIVLNNINLEQIKSHIEKKYKIINSSTFGNYTKIEVKI